MENILMGILGKYASQEWETFEKKKLLEVQWNQHLHRSGFSYYPLVSRETFISGRHCFQHAASFKRKFLFLMLTRIYVFPPSPMYRPYFFPLSLPRPTFLFAAPIKFVLVSRVMRMTIRKWNKKVKLYVSFIHASTNRCKHTRVWNTKKKLYPLGRVFILPANEIKNASSNIRTGDFLTIANTVTRLMRHFVSSVNKIFYHILSPYPIFLTSFLIYLNFNLTASQIYMFGNV